MLAIFLGIFSAAVAALAAAIAWHASKRVAEMERALPRPAPVPPPAFEEPAAKPLAGLKIRIAVSQDHPHAVFAALLKEQLLVDDVDVVEGEADIDIAGTVACNGYAEVYYTAELICRSSSGVILTMVEKPAHGDRQSNLAIELVTRLKHELEKLVTRNERRRALRELGG
jgi:hypothetical protein